MWIIGAVVFVGFLLVFGVSMSRSTFKDDSFNQNAMWLTIGALLVFGMLAAAGMLRR
jgi:hypothetical protein